MEAVSLLGGFHSCAFPHVYSVSGRRAVRHRATFATSIMPETEQASPTPSPSFAPEESAEAASNSSNRRDWNLKGSSQLTRWARARRIRSGKLAGRNSPPEGSYVNGKSSFPEKTDDGIGAQILDHDDKGNASPLFPEKENVIYLVSDGTGWTVEHSVHAALGQFEHCLADQGCSVNTHLFSEVSDVERLVEIVRDAGKERAILVYTLADPVMAETAKKACQLHGVSHLDMLGPITELLGSHLGVAPIGLPRGAPGRKTVLSKEYFKRIEAVEYTIKQDDGALPKNLHKADVVLVGVSRTSKTPLSTYMAQKGYKVANVPLVLGVDPPKELFEMDQNKIYALTINPNYLQAIRFARYKSLGVSSPTAYSDLDHIKKELDYTSKLFSQNPKWPVIEVTGKAIEETAAVILRIYHDREQKYVMPRISRRY
ncbi:hypothetical protein KP509_24G072000 [Ceratopteris richardii]|uniref:Pyruvate, phosphate dikinase regulatory protein, chloroplastic n=1 Tax=Ceratopteris richardii TaxID=49495 RepID=A0A8T2RWA8_CERRI|nr:hypothetical protein KP509_24G072000 [Ceratopteris richardii]KAH7300630.1 hypothetical protein KP509_24G072000 [Ceratopteris richardii]